LDFEVELAVIVVVVMVGGGIDNINIKQSKEQCTPYAITIITTKVIMN